MAIKFLDSTGLTYFINKIVYGITSPKFSTGSTYTVGNFVIYTGKLYRCTTAVTVAGAWSASKWVQTTVSAELATINSNMSLIKTYVGTDGKLHSVDATGADSVLNFSQDLYCFALGGAQGTTYTKSVAIGSYKKIYITDIPIYIYDSGQTFSIVATGGTQNVTLLSISGDPIAVTVGQNIKLSDFDLKGATSLTFSFSLSQSGNSGWENTKTNIAIAML